MNLRAGHGHGPRPRARQSRRRAANAIQVTSQDAVSGILARARRGEPGQAHSGQGQADQADSHIRWTKPACWRVPQRNRVVPGYLKRQPIADHRPHDLRAAETAGSFLAAAALVRLEPSSAGGHDERPGPGVDEHDQVRQFRFHPRVTWERTCRRHWEAGWHRHRDRPGQRVDRRGRRSITEVSQHGFADSPSRRCPHRGPLSCLLAHHRRTRRRLQPDPRVGQGSGTYRAKHWPSHRVGDDHLVPDDRGNLQRPPTRLPPDCDTPPVRCQARL